MFSKLALFAAAAFAASAIADENQCNTGSIQCCNSSQSVEQYKASYIHSLLGIDVSNVVGQIGFNCSPIGGVNVGTGSKCAAEPFCCKENKFNGLVVVGCTPISLL